ncbi:sensor histidine kinase [Gracilimonas mengyeensis]|uniref:histidine kinase n=1 Tax=Gracilimonas mengyeensis TaxID=1302730 RepID=A0A521BKH5_9BACT|nr:sensor histidine kinase [Gracilimonas mengyeensis]SMO47644.1 Two-component sensor histidine kinase, contains HisKA and HATPase domains [Gracilimonas mengyeensis]
MQNPWKKYKLTVRKNCLGSFNPSDGLDYWRNKLFATIIIYLLPLSLLVLVPSLLIVYALDLQSLSIAYTCIAIAISLVSLYSGFSITTRKYLFVALVYAAATILIFYMGEHGAGLTYLFGATVFAMLILPTRAGVFTIVINVAICALQGMLIHYNIAEYPLRDSYQVASWIAISANSILLSVVAVIFMPMLFSGLQRTIESQKDLRKHLITHQEQLERSLEEKETMLAEIHHRVKNNMAVISGMLQMQSFKEPDEEVQKKLLDSTLRIKSMANVHELLYQSHSFSNLSFDEGLRKLVQTVQDTMETNTNVSIEFELESVQLNINQALPCSLILNEVITNAMKHAFTRKETGKISIRLQQKNNYLSLQITDNGHGISQEKDEISEASLGLELIESLTQQLEADYKYQSRKEQPGTVFELSFPIAEINESIMT